MMLILVKFLCFTVIKYFGELLVDIVNEILYDVFSVKFQIQNVIACIVSCIKHLRTKSSCFQIWY